MRKLEEAIKEIPPLRAAVLSAVLVAVFFSGAFFTHKVFFQRDILIQFYPWKVFASSEISEGRVPLWNPYTMSGMPFAANFQSAVFYPFNVLFYVFPFPAALKVYVFAHFFIAVFFMFLLARDFALSPPAVLASAVVFAFSGFMISRTEFLSVLGTCAWFPALFLGLRNLARRRTGENVLILSVLFSLAFLAGHPQMLLFEIAVLLCYAAAFAARSKNFLFPAYFFVSGFLAMLFSAVQLIPSIEFFLNSVRSGGLAFDVFSANSLLPGNILMLVNPFQKYNMNLWASACYVGIVPLAASVYALLSGRRFVYFLWAILFFSLFFAFGKCNPVFGWVYGNFEFLHIVRYPATLLFISVFSLSLLAGFGISFLKARNPAKFFLVLVVFIDLFLVGKKFYNLLPANIFKAYGRKTHFLMKRNGFHRFILTPKTDKNMAARGDNIFEAWVKWKDNLYGNTNVVFRLFNAYGQDLMLKRYHRFTRKIFEMPTASAAEKWLSLLNVKYILSADEIKSEKYKEVLPGKISVYENRGCLPRAFFAEKAVRLSSDGVFDFVFRPDFDPLETVAIEKPGKILRERKNFVKNFVKILKYQSDRVEISVSSKKSGWLVLLDVFYPGWKVYVDGKKEKIYRADYVFRSVPVSAGTHFVSFVYEPAAFEAGFYFTILSLIAAEGFLFFRRKA
ncbi:MAG: YfhO family protein [Elusimicrobia bacterium]|nr:YfhO family protein [Elusimicrobiota bacterium]